jgi:hypothetical protein
MACYHPLKGYRSKDRNPSGRRSIVFNKAEAFTDLEIEIPCGQCIGCRLERSRQWAVRCVHELQMHDKSCYLTLTYSPENLPRFGSLKKKDFQDFMKRLRKHFSGSKIRFFHCGEYGENGARPHYHACVFGIDFDDKEKHKKNPQGDQLYTSRLLEKIWGKGHCTIGNVTFASAAYVARYITKKIIGPRAELHYNHIDFETGEVLAEHEPEYVTMSRRPGIGIPWYEKFKTDCYPSDFVVVNLKRMRIPRAYEAMLQKEDSHKLAQLKAERRVAAGEHSDDLTHERLLVREEVQYLKIDQLKRKYEVTS